MSQIPTHWKFCPYIASEYSGNCSLIYSSCLASGSGSEEEEEDDDEEEESSSQSEGEEEEGEEESVSGSGRSEHSAEDVSEDEQSDDDSEEERENGNHIPAGGRTVLMSVKVLLLNLFGRMKVIHTTKPNSCC